MDKNYNLNTLTKIPFLYVYIQSTSEKIISQTLYFEQSALQAEIRRKKYEGQKGSKDSPLSRK